MRNGIAALVLGGLLVSPLYGHDNGAQVLGCDYAFGKVDNSGQCLVVGSGMNQGVSWLVFEVLGKRLRYTDDAAHSIERIDKSGRLIARYPVRNSTGPCRPGGRTADIYTFTNGDKVCLYWP